MQLCTQDETEVALMHDDHMHQAPDKIDSARAVAFIHFRYDSEGQETYEAWARALDEFSIQEIGDAFNTLVSTWSERSFFTLALLTSTLRSARNQRIMSHPAPPAPSGLDGPSYLAWRRSYTRHLEAGRTAEEAGHLALNAIPQNPQEGQ